MTGKFYSELKRIFEGLSDRAVAREIGMDHSSVLQWKRGSEPSRDTVRKICERKGWPAAEQDRLNRIADGYSSEPLSKNIDFATRLFQIMANSPKDSFPSEVRDQLSRLEKEYSDIVWQAIPPATEEEIAEAYARGDIWDGPEEPETLNQQSNDQDARIKTLEAEINKRDARIADLETEIQGLKAQIGGSSNPAAAVRARRKK